MLNFADIAVFAEAAQAKSLAAAARRLGMTSMTASRRVAALESELGVRLLHRTTRSLSLTSEGEAYLPHALALLAQEAEGRASVSPGQSGAAGVLRVTASAPFGRKVVTPMLNGFLSDHPALRVELLLDDEVTDIAARGIDLALRMGPLRDSTLMARRLADNTRGLYAAPDYVAAQGAPVTMAELEAHPCLLLPGMTHWTFQSDGKTLRQRVKGRFASDGYEALKEAAVRGLGIARLSSWYVQDDLAAGRLVEITLRDAALPEDAIFAVYPASPFTSLKVRLFIEALQAHLSGVLQAARSKGGARASPSA